MPERRRVQDLKVRATPTLSSTDLPMSPVTPTMTDKVLELDSNNNVNNNSKDIAAVREDVKTVIMAVEDLNEMIEQVNERASKRIAELEERVLKLEGQAASVQQEKQASSVGQKRLRQDDEEWEENHQKPKANLSAEDQLVEGRPVKRPKSWVGSLWPF
ncbi:uncharacterized protein SPPG_05289 [Spizellomyces punctatus DAOM BR117]|uniref:Uncharacterized protein n=1 Tax=Spizellomyces punctatus (strain DAOM BR117) TaxID=645134 RepID=A0A0L0HFN8_SPIPD|nr:uncharacterized protein SPPG_05289 [Spizellomyces punctatus DAOM BR117]KNC99917.1 hypothetical protein SPPG_05289 [Spizellomyces punctatus DAOM BR117]|eukprot:XP_016607957.1 hypothetical protein SPPG_05289 [Spizellomyces punctatus DAOM BR117]